MTSTANVNSLLPAIIGVAIVTTASIILLVINRNERRRIMIRRQMDQRARFIIAALTFRRLLHMTSEAELESEEVRHERIDESVNVWKYSHEEANSDMKTIDITDEESPKCACSMLENDQNSNMCSICLEPYEVGDEVCSSNTKQCEHMFHLNCISDWLMKHHDHCPMCRCDFLIPKANENDTDKFQDDSTRSADSSDSPDVSSNAL